MVSLLTALARSSLARVAAFVATVGENHPRMDRSDLVHLKDRQIRYNNRLWDVKISADGGFSVEEREASK